MAFYLHQADLNVNCSPSPYSDEGISIHLPVLDVRDLMFISVHTSPQSHFKFIADLAYLLFEKVQMWLVVRLTTSSDHVTWHFID